MKMYFLGSACLLLMACHTLAVGGVEQNQLDVQSVFLSEAIANTPYSAVVKHTDVEVVNSPDDEFISKHIYYAEVIETIRGEESENIRYTMFVERGEDVDLDSSPVIITLCLDNGNYYWPGVGAQFNANDSLIHLAKNRVLKAEPHQSHFAHCD